jgi:hypothetical protein
MIATFGRELFLVRDANSSQPAATKSTHRAPTNPGAPLYKVGAITTPVHRLNPRRPGGVINPNHL